MRGRNRGARRWRPKGAIANRLIDGREELANDLATVGAKRKKRPGAYVLVIRLGRRREIELGRFAFESGT